MSRLRLQEILDNRENPTPLVPIKQQVIRHAAYGNRRLQ